MPPLWKAGCAPGCAPHAWCCARACPALQIINAERAAATAQELADKAREQKAAVEAELTKQREAAARLQKQIVEAAAERKHIKAQLAAAEVAAAELEAQLAAAAEERERLQQYAAQLAAEVRR